MLLKVIAKNIKNASYLGFKIKDGSFQVPENSPRLADIRKDNRFSVEEKVEKVDSEPKKQIENKREEKPGLLDKFKKEK